MCGRSTLRTKLNIILNQFAAEIAEEQDWEPRYNIAPTQNVPRTVKNEVKTCRHNDLCHSAEIRQEWRSAILEKGWSSVRNHKSAFR